MSGYMYYSRITCWRLCKTVSLPAFFLTALIKSSNKNLCSGYISCSGIEINQNPWFVKASMIVIRQKQTKLCFNKA